MASSSSGKATLKTEFLKKSKNKKYKNLKINTFPKLLLFRICFKLLCDIYFLFLCSFSESLRMITASFKKPGCKTI